MTSIYRVVTVGFGTGNGDFTGFVARIDSSQISHSGIVWTARIPWGGAREHADGPPQPPSGGDKITNIMKKSSHSNN